jgi:hypothetical protein
MVFRATHIWGVGSGQSSFWLQKDPDRARMIAFVRTIPGSIFNGYTVTHHAIPPFRPRDRID